MQKLTKFLGRLLQNTLLETVVLAFVLYLLFDRLRAGYNSSDYSYPASRLWGVAVDIGHYWYFYVIALIVIVWWICAKVKESSKADKDRGDMISAIRDQSESVKALTERIDKLITKLEK